MSLYTFRVFTNDQVGGCCLLAYAHVQTLTALWQHRNAQHCLCMARHGAPPPPTSITPINAGTNWPQVSYTSWFLDAFNYAMALKMNIVNLSIGAGPSCCLFALAEIAAV